MVTSFTPTLQTVQTTQHSKVKQATDQDVMSPWPHKMADLRCAELVLVSTVVNTNKWLAIVEANDHEDDLSVQRDQVEKSTCQVVVHGLCRKSAIKEKNKTKKQNREERCFSYTTNEYQPVLCPVLKERSTGGATVHGNTRAGIKVSPLLQVSRLGDHQTDIPAADHQSAIFGRETPIPTPVFSWLMNITYHWRQSVQSGKWKESERHRENTATFKPIPTELDHNVGCRYPYWTIHIQEETGVVKTLRQSLPVLRGFLWLCLYYVL